MSDAPKYNPSVVINYDRTDCCGEIAATARRVVNTDAINSLFVALAMILENGYLLVLYYDIDASNNTVYDMKTMANEFGASYPLRKIIILNDWSVNQYDCTGKVERIITKEEFLIK